MPIVFIHGFLGSGKTTLVNYLGVHHSELRLAVIINEYAATAVQSSPDSLKPRYINAGSIFCSCISDQLIETLRELVKGDYDYLLVEASGLADPASLDRLMREAFPQGQVYYNLTLADGVNLKKLLNTLPLTQRQLEVADLVVLNKTDLLSEEEITETVALIREYSKAPLLKTCYAEVGDALLHLAKHTLGKMDETLDKDLNLRYLSLEVPESMTEEKLGLFFKAIKNRVYRAKGIVKLREGQRIAELASGQISLKASTGPLSRLVVLFNIESISAGEIKAEFTKAQE